MAFAPNFDRAMKRALEKKAPAYTWETGWSAEGERWKVDLAGHPSSERRPLVLIEVELKRDDPAGNVIKIWRWARIAKSPQGIVFIQAFSKHFWQTKIRQRVRAIFVGERMMEDRKLSINYKWERMKFRPRMVPGQRTKEGAGRMVQAAKLLANRIARMIP